MMTVLTVLWFFLIFVLIAGYFVLDGFDLGAGVLYPFIAKTEEDQAIVRRSIGPVWDGNEVWLLTAGGALFAAFPDAYATTFSGFYLAVMLVLFGLIVRAVSFEFWAADKKWRGVWNVCFFLGSLLPALLLGVAVGNIYAGIPMDAAGNYIGVPLLGLVTPFTLLTGLLGLAMFLAAGACWVALKAPLDSAVRARAAKLRAPLGIVALALFVVVSAYALMAIVPEIGEGFYAGCVVFALVFVLALLAALWFGLKKRCDLGAFLAQSVGSFSLTALLACSMFPNLVVASADSIGPNITLMSAGASELSLTCMTIILCIGLPLVLVYHVIVYRTFRGRVEASEMNH